jgi:vacuolar iron transporter family protein
MIKIKNISFGVISAIMTGLAIIIGLSNSVNAKINIITALLILAIADNLSDSFGINVHEESNYIPSGNTRKIVVNNFIVRLLTCLVLVIIVLVFPMNLVILISIIFGIVMLILLSYFIAKNKKINPFKTISRYLILAIIIMLLGFLFREIISKVVTS